jgi:hypothetical protein
MSKNGSMPESLGIATFLKVGVTRVGWISRERPLKNALLTGFWGPKMAGSFWTFSEK